MRESAVKERILDVAARLFYQQGYNSTGINQVIDEADIAKGSLYNHFPSKSDLLVAYLQQAHERWFADMEVYLSPIKDPRKKILGLFDFRLNRQLVSNFSGCQFIKASAEIGRGEPKAMDQIKMFKDRLNNYILSLVKQAEHKKFLTDEMLTDTIFLLLEGSSTTGVIQHSPEATRKAKKIIEQFL
ncbi:TetR/AcrR family transcriptional regulator [Chitinophaga agrisoli]|nr:TetR/AcrR family transcriptional regulator [Chitinophaga agrisoli]